MRHLLDKYESVLRLAYRIAVIALLLWICSILKHSDQSWYLSAIMEMLQRR